MMKTAETTKDPATKKTEQLDARGRIEEKKLVAAIRSEKAGSGVQEMLRRAHAKSGAAPTITIRIAAQDIEKARALAKVRGLKYQTYIKMLLHEALQREALVR